MKAIQAQVDAHLPGHVNRVLCSHCDHPEAVVVESWSDKEPTTDWIYRPAHDEWVEIGQEVHGVEPAAMGRLDFYRIKARDGEDLPLWLTTPPGPRQARPAVVYVHGGPWARDPPWGWHPAEQFLASRGYVVLQPEFRGSVGYGRRHLLAGAKHWGDTMQDDVADAVRWAVAKGFVDPKRICIIGASYGGYAALMGPIRDPGLYRCAVSWVAVTDPALLYTADWTSDISEEGRRYVLPSLLGDGDTDRTLLAAASPVDRAAEVRVPVLLAYGLLDRRVPLKHGNRMREALTEAGNPPQWVLYPDEGHGWFNSDDRIDFWQRVERFLAASLR